MTKKHLGRKTWTSTGAGVFVIEHHGFTFELSSGPAWFGPAKWMLAVRPPLPVKVEGKEGEAIAGEEVAKKRALEMIEAMLKTLREKV